MSPISSFYDRYNVGSLHLFPATTSGDYETYWYSTGGTKTTVGINNL